jgi:hypothetical protein
MLARRNSWAHYQAQCEDLAAGRAEWNMCITLRLDPAHGAEQRHTKILGLDKEDDSWTSI